SRMPVTTWIRKVNSNRLPKAADQREPPGRGSRRSTCFRRRQPVRVSQNPPCGGDSCVVLMSVTPTSSDIYRCLLTDADLEVLTTDPQPAGADLKGKRIHVAGRGAAGFLAGGVEQPGVAGADEPRLIRVPVDGTAQVRADRGKDT